MWCFSGSYKPKNMAKDGPEPLIATRKNRHSLFRKTKSPKRCKKISYLEASPETDLKFSSFQSLFPLSLVS